MQTFSKKGKGDHLAPAALLRAGGENDSAATHGDAARVAAPIEKGHRGRWGDAEDREKHRGDSRGQTDRSR